jgi:hypothetical protein
VSPLVPAAPDPHPVSKSSDIATCPVAPGMPPDRGGLQCHHVSRCSLQGRALTSPRAPWHRTLHQAGKGLGVAMCPTTPDPPPSAGGLWRRHVPYGSQPPRPGRAFSWHLTSGSSWPHQARGVGNTLNAYKTSHTWSMASIKCIQDIDTVGR